MTLNRTQLNQQFLLELQRLNAQQRSAVEHIEGPVMVIAGPGTGKTQILAARIGKILLETDVLPNNILCLTYTDAGTVAMRKRLLSFIGPDAYKVNIYTFHAFCNDIIQENLSLFEKNTLDPLSELERIQLMKQLIDAFPKNHPLKRYRGDVYFDIKPLQQLFSVMKREGWSAAFIEEKIEEYLQSLPQRDEYIAKRNTQGYQKGDVRWDRIEAEKEKMERLLAAVREFDHYQALMREKNRYDFDDMINWVIRSFREHPHLLSLYQERYQYILVDEYQDTSGTQNLLVQQLISYWDAPNIFVVGDDDQSIYRFQGANVENMKQFAEQHAKDLFTVVLTANYRSTQPILDIARTLIDHNKERLIKQISGLSKELVASNEQIRQLHALPVIREYESTFHEMAHITEEIHQLINQGVIPAHIGVIYRENKYGDELARYFRQKGLPVFSKRNVNILTIPLVKKILQLLRYIAAELEMPYSGDELLFEILHYDFFHIPPAEIARISIIVSEKKYTEKTSIRQYLYDCINTTNRSLFQQQPHEAIMDASTLLEKWIGDAPNVTIQQLFERIIREGGILQYLLQQVEKPWLLQVLSTLFDFVKEETHRNPTATLQELMQTIDLMADNELPIELVQVTGNDQAVNLLTAHGSKGLEFEYVFLMGCNADFWEKKRKPTTGFRFPDTVFASHPTSSEEEELRRLFYVALTRAEKHLYISYPRFRNDGKEMEPSRFIAEILEKHPLPKETIQPDPVTLMNFATLPFLSEQVPELERVEAEMVNRQLENFVMNVTALNNYLKCPLQFYYQNLLRVPSGKSESTEFGSAVHFALQRLFEKMQRHPQQQFPTKQELLNDFKWYLQHHRESFTKEGYARRTEYGNEILSSYYDKYLHTWSKVVSVECNIKNVVVNGVPLKGKLDKLEFDGNNVKVVDYKTGDVEKAKEKLAQPSEKNPKGGDYWRQAVFYKILVDNYKLKNWKVISTEFDFVEPDKKKEYLKEPLTITPEDIRIVTDQITDTWQKIRQHQFYVGCGKEDCHWCNFVKDNQLQVALHEVMEEEE